MNEINILLEFKYVEIATNAKYKYITLIDKQNKEKKIWHLQSGTLHIKHFHSLKTLFLIVRERLIKDLQILVRKYLCQYM